VDAEYAVLGVPSALGLLRTSCGADGSQITDVPSACASLLVIQLVPDVDSVPLPSVNCKWAVQLLFNASTRASFMPVSMESVALRIWVFWIHAPKEGAPRASTTPITVSVIAISMG
jgi:hypothetical protein